MTKNLKHSQEGLIEAFEEHLQYEVNMLRAMHLALNGPVWILNAPIGNAAIESFCVHARNLIDFFDEKSETPGQARSDYAGAKHFCRSGYQAWGAGRPNNALIGKLSRQISHLTYDRTKDIGDKIGPGERMELMISIEQELVNFGNNLKSLYREKWRCTQIQSEG